MADRSQSSGATQGDARFEDGGPASDMPLFIKAMDAASLPVISALVQDAVYPITEMRIQKTKRRFAALINRFRWEDADAARAEGRPFERVQSLLLVEDMIGAKTTGIDRSDPDLVLSLLSIGFEPGEDGTGRLILTLAGDGAVALDVECLDVSLRDVTRPYAAPSGKAPRHDV
ncbi:DUF2948 family protein [Tropicimonas sp. IMCC34011]|uniref:DUF2948 family protein n=1 Tax=Tropicimonas sp. IMCC34011 TaxID=2248759 RepID=UPI000E24B3FD|nr:DUF2948 family protein [Tropicimonas sp. IMCC34011]